MLNKLAAPKILTLILLWRFRSNPNYVNQDKIHSIVFDCICKLVTKDGLILFAKENENIVIICLLYVIQKRLGFCEIIKSD